MFMVVIAADLYHLRLGAICWPKPVAGGFEDTDFAL